jgi:surfeit locus 1 family protein
VTASVQAVPAWRRLWLPTLLMLVAAAVLLSLGTWQLERLAWKEALIEAAATRPEAPPVAPPLPAEWDKTDWEAADLTHLAVRGRFLPGEAHVYTVLSDARGPLSGPGLWIMAPFQTADGWVVLVNRGFVPTGMDGAMPPVPPPPAGDLTLEGLLRRPDPPGPFTPEPNPQTKLWFVRDAASLATAFSLPGGTALAPFTIDADAATTPPGGLPQAGETRRVFTNNHLQYALTWYGLAAALVGVWLVFVAGRLRRR